MSGEIPSLRIISGGQTGVDRAALDVALELSYECSGWCPRGRKAEDGTIAARYPLRETTSTEYPQRTEWNVRDSDAILILAYGELQGGTLLTAEMARKYKRPLLVVDLGRAPKVESVRGWIRDQKIKVLNIAGPREGTAPGIYGEARAFLTELLRSV